MMVIALTALLVITPFFWLGDPSGHDFEFHLNSWMEVLSQWKQGILYPRWAAMAHFGYGEARFVFYPPLSWLLGALLGACLPWRFVPGAFVWIALVLSGASMYALARQYLSEGEAIFAAALYAANPYYLVVIYWRSAYAELLAGALLPLLLLFVLRAEQLGNRAVIPLSLIVAGAWLTNAPAAVMVNYSLALLLIFAAIRQRSSRLLWYGAAAAAIGAALAAFYVVPAAYEQKWVNIGEVLSLGVRPIDNFLFTTMPDVDHNRFNLLVSVVAFAELAAMVALTGLMLRKKPVSELGWTLLAWSVVSSVLMFRFTLFAWDHFPKLRFVQLPWRWLLCLNLAFALLLVMASRRWLVRGLTCAVMLLVIVMVWQRVQPPWWDTYLDLFVMQDDIKIAKGYEGTDEYVPAGADPYEIDREARRVIWEGSGHSFIHILKWDAESRVFLIDVDQPGNAVLRLFNYPAWSVEVNGQVSTPVTREVTGQMVIPLQPGKNSIMLTFSRTLDRTIGGLISLVTAGLLAVFWSRWRDQQLAISGAGANTGALVRDRV